MPKINYPVSDSRSLDENCPLSHVEPDFLLAFLGSTPCWLRCLQRSPQRGGPTKKACAIDSCREREISCLQWSAAGHIHYTPGQAPHPGVADWHEMYSVCLPFYWFSFFFLSLFLRHVCLLCFSTFFFFERENKRTRGSMSVRGVGSG